MIPENYLRRPFLPVTTNRLTLRPLETTDAEAMAKLANDERVAKTLARLPYPYTIEDAHQFIPHAKEELTSGNHVIFAIIRRADQKFMGIIGLEEELGYWLGHEFWGQGYGKEAAKGLVHFAFTILRLPRIEGSALKGNPASCRIFEGLGFQKMGEKAATSHGYKGTKPAITYALSRHTFLEKEIAIERPLVWVVLGALINKDDQLLLSQRLTGKYFEGVWELPGGKIEPAETPEHALIRELKEELSIDVKEDDIEPLTFGSYRYDSFHIIMPLYICQKWKGTPHGAEGQNLAWVRYSDLPQYPLLPADSQPAHHLADILKMRGIWV